MPLANRVILFLSILIFGGVSASFSQEVIDGPDGKKIILYKDGTWEPYGVDGDRAAFTPDSVELEKNLAEFRDAQQNQKRLSLELIQKRIEVARLELELANFEAKDGVAEQVIFDLRNKASIAKQKMIDLELSLKQSKRWTALMERVVYLSSGLRQKTIETWKKNNFIDSNPVQRRKQYVAYSAEKDVMLTPPEKPCEFIFSGVDRQMGRKRQDVRPAVLFSYSDPGVESHFLKNDLIVGRVHLTSLSAGRQLLNLEISIASKQAPKLFGGIKPNDFIRMKMIDGQQLKLLNNDSDGGKWDEVRQAYVYRIQFPIGAKEYRILSKSELDKVEVRWSNVKEEYEVLDVDILKRQFACLIGS